MKITLIALAVILSTGFLTTASVYATDTKTDASEAKKMDTKATAQDCDSDAHYPLISKDDLKKHVDAKDAFIVDVNSDESYKESHVGNAIHFGDHKKDFAKLLPASKDALVVAYCGGPSCEAWLSAAKQACKLGYTNIQHFKDGISGWKKM